MKSLNVSRQLSRFLKNSRTYYTVESDQRVKFETSVGRQIYAKIKATGPVTVADYMKEVLVNPQGGYYMHKAVIGASGDFVTSPELTQVFGELVAVWLLNEWTKMGSPRPFQIVELGPGRGTLSQDVLRVFNHFKLLKGASLCLVEVSRSMADVQAGRLCFQTANIQDPNAVVYREGLTHEGVPVKWYRQYADVPDGFSILIAHEFFDVLPIHKIQKTDNGYREVLIDIDSSEDLQFRYVIAREETPIIKAISHQKETRNHFEISPESLVLCKSIAKRLESDGGLALIVDYGHNGDGTDTFRAFKKHQLHDPLCEPGTADLTADVDFFKLKTVATEANDVIAFGPVDQRDFLLNMGIEQRVDVLKKNAKDEEVKALEYSYQMMIDEDKMGKRFKFFSLFPSVLSKIFDKCPVAGFN